MTKRVLSLFLAVLTLFALCVPALAANEPADEPEPASVVASGSCGASGSNVKWSISSDRVLTISGTGRMKDYPLPYSQPTDPRPWRDYMDYDGLQFTSIVVKSGVTYIGNYAFSNAYANKSLTIAGTVTEIGTGAFFGTNLTDLKLPNGLKKIGARAFESCGLTNAEIPQSVTYIGTDAFNRCTVLKKFTVWSKTCTIAAPSASYCDTLPRMATIYGYKGSTTETYAKKYGCKFVALSSSATPPTDKKGWVTENGQKYYYQNGEKLKGLYIIGGKKYYFSPSNGAMLTGIYIINGKRYYFSPQDGSMQKGIQTVNGKVYYFSAKDGHRITGIVTVDNAGHKCYFSAKTGYQLKGLVTTDAKGTQRYFSVKTGYMLKNGWYNIGGGKKALINASGVVTKITKI